MAARFERMNTPHTIEFVFQSYYDWICMLIIAILIKSDLRNLIPELKCIESEGKIKLSELIKIVFTGLQDYKIVEKSQLVLI